MPRVPQYGDNSPQVRETPLRAPEATPASFGAGQAEDLSRLGQGLKVAGETGSNILVKLQEQENLQAVFAAETQIKNAEIEFHDSVRKMKGVNAKEVLPQAIKFWDQQYEAAIGTLTNDAQQRAFERIYESRRNGSMSMVSQHRAIETRRAAIDAGNASIKASIENTINNPGAAEVNAQSIRDTFKIIGDMNGDTSDVTNGKIQDALTEMHSGVIDSLVDKYPGAARAYYNDILRENKDEIKPSARDAIEDVLRQGDLKGFSQRKATEIMLKTDDYTEQRRLAREIKNPERQAATVAEINARQAEEVSLKKLREGEAYQETLKQILNDPEIQTKLDIDPNLWEAMSGTDQNNILSHLTAKTEKKMKGRVADDTAVRRHVDRLIQDNQLNDTSQLAIYDPFLTTSTVKGFETAIEKAKQISRSTLHTEFATRAQMPESKWGTSQYALWDSFQDYAYKSVQDGTYTNRDIKELADDFFLKTGEGWFDATEEMTFGEAFQENPKILDDAMVLYNAMAAAQKLGVPAPEVTRRGLLVAVREVEAANVPFDQYHIAAALVLRGGAKKRTAAAIKHRATIMKAGEKRATELASEPLPAPTAPAPIAPPLSLPEDYIPE